MRVRLFGVEIDNLTRQETIEKIDEFIRSGWPHRHVVINVNKVVMANKYPQLQQIINKSDLVNVDGMPIVWISRLLGKPLKERVAGIDLFFDLLKRADEKKYKIFLLGAVDESLSKAIEILKEKYPGLDIVGVRNGYWKSEDELGVVGAIQKAAPHILFVAISSPRKELFVEKYFQQLRVPFVMGVGGSFDVLAGKIKRAPMWMQKLCLEWFYRFLQEPKRMFYRYFVEGLYFFVLIFRECFRKV